MSHNIISKAEKQAKKKIIEELKTIKNDGKKKDLTMAYLDGRLTKIEIIIGV